MESSNVQHQLLLLLTILSEGRKGFLRHPVPICFRSEQIATRQSSSLPLSDFWICGFVIMGLFLESIRTLDSRDFSQLVQVDPFCGGINKSYNQSSRQ